MSTWLVLFAVGNAFAAGWVGGWFWRGRAARHRELLLRRAWRVTQLAWEQAQIDRDEAIRLGADRARLTPQEAYKFAVIEEEWMQSE
jgi:hypothetical protein